MSSDRFRLGLLGSVVAVVILLSVGFGTAPTSGQPDADELVEEAITSMQTESIEAVGTLEITRPSGEIQQTVAIHEDPPHHGHFEILDAPGEAAGQEIVLNGSTAWKYDEDTGTAIQYHRGDYWFDEFQAVGANPEEVIDHYESDYKEKTFFEGREVHVVELTPPDDKTVSLSLDINAGGSEYEVPLHEAGEQTWYLARETWWIYTNTSYPVKQEVRWTDKNGNVVATTTREYEELTVGADIDKEVFEFDPSEGVENETGPEQESDSVSDTGWSGVDIVETEVFDSRTAATLAVPFELPAPEVPDEYSFEMATVQSHDSVNTTILWYTSESDSLSVQVSAQQSPLFRNFETSVIDQSISEFDGHVDITDTGVDVVRNCGDLTYRVSGPPQTSVLIDVAGSIECQ